MTNASSFWTTLVIGNNGNGDGIIPFGSTAASTTGETYQLWNELALAGLIEGRYTGLSGPAGAYDAVNGVNVPKSKISRGAWGVWSMASYGGDPATYAGEYGNAMVIGGQGTNSWPAASIFKPKEAWNIDTKVDDGKPGTGRIIPREDTTWAAASTGKCTTSTGNTDYAGGYNLTNTNIVCAIMVAKAF